MLSRALISKLLRFSAVGVVVAGTFMGLNWLFGHSMGRQAAFLLSYPPALALHFCLNKWWTFACQRTDTTRQVSEYLVMVAVTFLLQWGVFTALTRWAQLPAWLDAGVANVAQIGVSFLFMQIRIFGARREA